MEVVERYRNTLQSLAGNPDCRAVFTKMYERVCDLSADINNDINQRYGFSAYAVSPVFHRMITSTFSNTKELKLRLEKGDAVVDAVALEITDMIHQGLTKILSENGFPPPDIGE